MILSIKEQWQKPRRAPDRTPRTPLPQQSSSSAREEEGRWVLEDKRRRNVAFENLAKEMLRYLENIEDVKVGITERQEQLEVFVQTGTALQQVAQQARSEIGQKFFLRSFGKKKTQCVHTFSQRSDL